MSFPPRKPESISWTSFPEELAEKIKEVFQQTYLKNSTGQSFVVEGRIYEAEILLRVGLLTAGRLAQDNFETSIDLTLPTDNIHKRIHLCVDALGRCFDDYFGLLESSSDEEESLVLPYSKDWQETELEGDLLFVRYSSVNTILETEADRLLGSLDESLYRDVTVGDDALARAEVDTEAATERQKKIRSEFH